MTSARTTIADDVEVLHQGPAGQVPDAVLSEFAAEQAGLDAAGVPASAAHDSVTGWPVRVQQPRIYQGEWCPYCNVALRNYQANLVPVLEERGVGRIAVSPQKPDGSLTMAEKHQLTFTVLSDPGNQLAGALGIATAPTEGARGAQRATGTDLAARNADGTHGLPMPTVALIDAGAVIRWIDVHPNYATRTEVADIVAALDAHLS